MPLSKEFYLDQIKSKYPNSYNESLKDLEVKELEDMLDFLDKALEKADGGSMGIEVLFKPKVPAAPSQLVSESDILLGYRGPGEYQGGGGGSKGGGGNKSGGGGNKSGGGGGRDRDFQQRGMSKADYSKSTQTQNFGGRDNQTTKPNFKEKIKSVVTNPAVQLLGGALLTGGINLAFPGALDKLNKARMISNAIKYGKDIAIEDEVESIPQTGGIVPYADGGRVGLFMGGSPLQGEALSIYNSMKAYGNDDQTIADRLQALGMYTPGGSTPPETTTPNIIGAQINQGGDDKPMIQPFRQDPRVGAAFEAYQRNQGLKAMGIDDPFADEISLQGAYYDDMPNVDLKPGSQTFMGKLKSGIGEVMNFPLVKGMSLMTPFGFAKQGLGALENILPVNQRAIQENIMGNMGVAVDDIGRVVNTGDYSDPSNIMAGYSATSSPETFDKRIDRTSKTLSEKYGLSDQQIEGILSGTLTEAEMANVNSLAISDTMSKAYGKPTTTNLVKQLRSLAIAKEKSTFAQDLAKKEAERQRAEREAKKLERQRAKTREADTAAGAFSNVVQLDRGGGGTFKEQTAAKERQGVQVAGPGFGKGAYFADGGLATMFVEKR